MKKLAFGALMIGLLAACGGGGDGGPDLIDADNGDVDGDPPSACNAIEQTGCAAGEKCTWITISDEPELGRLGCVPDGTVALAAACTAGAPGETTGYDDCAAGGYCIGGICEAICGQTPDTCPTNFTCSSYSGLFDGVTPELGVCDSICDPGTKTTVDGNLPECGSPDVNAPNRGCYGFFDQIEYACTPAISEAVHNQDPSPLSSAGNPFLNSCAPGYQIFQAVGGQDADSKCIATCQPQAVSSSSPQNAEYGVAPHSLADRGVDDPAFECRYMWLFFQALPPARNFDKNGIAMNPAAWNTTIDVNGDGQANDTIPSCRDIGPDETIDPDGAGPMEAEDATLFWACDPYPAELQASPIFPGKVSGLKSISEKRRLR